MKKIQKPQAGEYAPYAIMYISLLPDDGLVLRHLLDNVKTMQELVLSQPEEKLTSRCAEGEWTIKEILVHILDTERIFAYRALRFARNDTTELPGFEQDAYVANSGANERSSEDILEEYTAVRMATIVLFKSFAEETCTRSGVVNGARTSVRAAAYIIAGHELHHLYSIRKNYLAEE
ncbi:MAG: DinB family protein [Ktedonobacteraceae bacterium]